jgi:ribonuclease HI
MEIYIDGSCRPKTNHGGCAVLIIYEDGTRQTLTAKKEGVTNNIMELQAFILALQHIKQNNLDKTHEIEIFSDSEYVVKGVTVWWDKWKSNDFKTTTGPVKNLEIWMIIEELKNDLKFKLTWVRGHSECANHNVVDKIAYNLTST